MADADEALAYGNLEAFIGRQIALGTWARIVQDDAIRFGVLTGDPDPMHVDPAWAQAHSPYGRTVAAGMHMMALLPLLTRGDALTIADVGLAMNYGFNRVRFVSPLPLDTPFRNRVTLLAVDRRDDGATTIVTRNQYELADDLRPVLVAEWVNLLWPVKS